MKSILSIPANELAGKCVIVRAGFDVPVQNGVVQNDFRIRAALPTIDYLAASDAKVILIAHIGRDPKETLRPVADALNTHIDVRFVENVAGEKVKHAVEHMNDGDVVLLENLRQDPREKENDEAFARELASYADLYVNDAFSNSHREHASIVGIPKYIPGYASVQFEREVTEILSMRTPESPSLFILGGAKFNTKLPLIEQFLEVYDHVVVGGALLNDVLKAEGYFVGDSLVSDVAIDEGIVTHQKRLPVLDVIVARADGAARVAKLDDISEGERVLDMGPDTVASLASNIENANTILWNGPLGHYEGGFITGTEEVAKMVGESNAKSLLGGGDTVAAIERLGLHERISFVSTGGGAMLLLLENGTLPGIEVLE